MPWHLRCYKPVRVEPWYLVRWDDVQPFRGGWNINTMAKHNNQLSASSDDLAPLSAVDVLGALA